MNNVKYLYSDGGVVYSGTPGASSIGGTWAFVATDENDEFVFAESGFHKTEDRDTTNNHTEYIAAVKALEAMDAGWSGTLVCDSKTTLARLFEGGANKNLPVEYIYRGIAALDRLGVVDYKHIDGHATKAQITAGIGKNGNPVSKWNSMCDKLCNEAKEPYALKK